MRTHDWRATLSNNRRKGFSLIELLIVVAIILIIAAIAIPNLVRSKMAANEASAVGSLHAINTAAVTYSTTYGQYPPNLSSLTTSGAASSTAADLVDTVLGSGTKSGYSFTYTVGASNVAFTVTASPVLLNVTGQRYFFTDQTFVIRANTSGAATSGSTPIS